MNIYDNGDGSHRTNTIFLVLADNDVPPDGGMVILTSITGGLSVTRRLYVNFGPPDAGPMPDAP